MLALLLALVTGQDPQERERQRAESIYLVRISQPLYRAIAQARLAENWPRLIALYDTLLIHEPRRAVAYFDRGLAKFRLRDTAGARRDLVQARQLGHKPADQYLYADGRLAVAPGSTVPFPAIAGPRRKFTLLERANRARELGYHAVAFATFDSALARDSTFDHAYASRGRLRLELGDTGGALVDFRDAERHASDRTVKASYQQLALSLLSDSARAAAIRPTLGKDPGKPSLWYRVLTVPSTMVVAAIVLSVIVYLLQLLPRRR